MDLGLVKVTIWHSLLITHVLHQQNQMKLIKKRNYFKGDYAAIRQCLEEIEWDTVLNGLDLSQSWSVFAEIIVELIEKFIPVSKVRDGRNKNNPYVNSSGLEAIKKKHTRWL